MEKYFLQIWNAVKESATLRTFEARNNRDARFDLSKLKINLSGNQLESQTHHLLADIRIASQ